MFSIMFSRVVTLAKLSKLKNRTEQNVILSPYESRTKPFKINPRQLKMEKGITCWGAENSSVREIKNFTKEKVSGA